MLEFDVWLDLISSLKLHFFRCKGKGLSNAGEWNNF